MQDGQGTGNAESTVPMGIATEDPMNAFVGKQANAMDPQLRMLLEVTYEAIADAG